MKFQKDGPKRRRFTRRELPYGQVRRWGSTVGNFKAERESRRAGLTGKITKHPTELIVHALGGGWLHSGDFSRLPSSRASASGEREQPDTSSRDTERGTEEDDELT